MSFAILDGKALTSSVTDQGLITWAVWTAILADKDQDGITTLNPRYICKVFQCPDQLDLVEEAFRVLSSPDPHSKNTEAEGRRIIPVDNGRWLVVSHEKYKQIYRKEVRREYLTQAKRAQRERERKATEQPEREAPISAEEAKAAFTEDLANLPSAPKDNPGRTHYVGDSCPGGHEEEDEVEEIFDKPSPPLIENEAHDWLED